jgi:hypothetical protein
MAPRGPILGSTIIVIAHRQRDGYRIFLAPIKRYTRIKHCQKGQGIGSKSSTPMGLSYFEYNLG